MATIRMTLEEVLAMPSLRDRAKIDATTEEDIRRHMIEDGEDPDAELPPCTVWLPVAAIRIRLGMTQSQFATTIGVPLATLRNWEQHRVQPDPAARSLLRILDREPEAALRALGAGRAA